MRIVISLELTEFHALTKEMSFNYATQGVVLPKNL